MDSIIIFISLYIALGLFCLVVTDSYGNSMDRILGIVVFYPIIICVAVVFCVLIGVKGLFNVITDMFKYMFL